jgi:exosortase/archaeosortase family protein
MKFKSLIPHFSSVSKEIRVFLLKLFLLIIGYLTAYNLVLKPTRIPDKWLTNIITSSVSSVLNIFLLESQSPSHNIEAFEAGRIVQGNKIIFIIADSCNGLDLMAIYLSVILLLPYSLKRKFIFGLGGVLAILIANILRCIGLYWIYVSHNSLFEINHHYTFTLLMYLLIFYGWLKFTQQQKHDIQ